MEPWAEEEDDMDEDHLEIIGEGIGDVIQGEVLRDEVYN